MYGWTRRLFDSAAGTLAKTLASVTARPVVKGDGLPTLLCRTCQRKLEKIEELELKLKHLKQFICISASSTADRVVMLTKRPLASPEGKPAAKKQDLSATPVALSDVYTTTGTESVGWEVLASQARLFRAVAELTARESHEEEELLPELLQREKSLVAFENVIVTWTPDPVS